MNKAINKLFDCINSGDIEKSEVLEINKALAVINIKNITEEQHENVKDYLINSLNMNSLDPAQLDNLLIEIEKLA